MALPSDRAVIEQLYRNYLGREADIGGLNYWLQTFGNDLSQDEIFQFIDGAVGGGELTPEQGEQFKAVTPLYLDTLNRLPDRGGLLYYANQFGTDVDAREMAEFEFAAKPELGIEPEPAPAPAPAPEPAPAAPANVDSKGRPYDPTNYQNIKNQLLEQSKAGIPHRASFSSDVNEIIDDMAKQLASYGVKSIYDLKQELYTDYEYPSTTTDEAVEPTPVQKQRVINSATGEEIPVNKLNNSRGDGFTYYKFEFANGVPVPYAFKEKTGLGAFTDQVTSVLEPFYPVLLYYAAPYLAGTGAALGATGTAANIIDAAVTGAVVSGATGQDPLKSAVFASLGPITQAYGADVGRLFVGDGPGAATIGSAILSGAASGLMASMTGGDIAKSILAGAVSGGVAVNAGDFADAFLSKEQIDSIANATGLSANQVKATIGKAFTDGIVSLASGGSGQDFIQTLGNSLLATGMSNAAANQVTEAFRGSVDPKTLDAIGRSTAGITNVAVRTAAEGGDVDAALQQAVPGILLTNVIQAIETPEERFARERVEQASATNPNLRDDIQLAQLAAGRVLTANELEDVIAESQARYEFQVAANLSAEQIAALPAAAIPFAVTTTARAAQLAAPNIIRFVTTRVAANDAAFAARMLNLPYVRELLTAFVAEFGIQSIAGFEDAYRGEYSSKADYAEQYVTDCYTTDLPDGVS